MKTYTLIKNDRELNRFRGHLYEKKIETIAMDFEAESNLHVYGEKICLIQIFDGERFFLIDTFGISRDELAMFLEDKKIVKYCYGSDSDLSMAFKQYQIRVKSVLDVKLLVDTLELEKKGLDAALESVLHITVTGKKRYQRYNWTVRPIRPEALEYALNDVAHLFDLYNELMKQITARNLHSRLMHALVRSRNDPEGNTVPTVYRSGEYHSLSRVEKALFDRLYEMRDRYAREMNVPPNVALAKEYLFQASRKALDVNTIRFEKRVPEKYRKAIAEAVRENMAAE